VLIGKAGQSQTREQHQRLLGGYGDYSSGVTLLLDECQAGGMEAFRQVDRNIRTVLERRANPPEMIEMLVADDQGLDLALLQQAVDALFGEAAVHPVGVPTGIEKQAAHAAIDGFGFQQRREAGCVIGVQ
jgi:hypothetical protein